MPSRRRLSPEERRDELLDAGAELFAELPFEQVTMEDVAARANASRALAYHYFQNRSELFGAIWKRAHDRLLAETRFGEPYTVREGMAATLSAHLDFYRANAPLVWVANRSPIASDPAVRGPVQDDLNAMCEMVLDACRARGRARKIAAAALVGWISFIREVTVEWLTAGGVSRQDVFDLCMAALDATVGVHLDLSASPGSAYHI